MGRLFMGRYMSAVGLFSRVLLLGAVRIACADDLAPTAVDEHAAYCIPVVQRQLQEQRALLDTLDQKLKDPKVAAALRKQVEDMQAEAHQQLTQIEHNLERMHTALQAHSTDSADAHAAAQERGTQDIVEFQAMLSRCARKCYAAGASIDKCEDECQDKKLLARVKSCFMPVWLP